MNADAALRNQIDVKKAELAGTYDLVSLQAILELAGDLVPAMNRVIGRVGRQDEDNVGPEAPQAPANNNAGAAARANNNAGAAAAANNNAGAAAAVNNQRRRNNNAPAPGAAAAAAADNTEDDEEADFDLDAADEDTTTAVLALSRVMSRLGKKQNLTLREVQVQTKEFIEWCKQSKTELIAERRILAITELLLKSKPDAILVKKKHLFFNNRNIPEAGEGKEKSIINTQNLALLDQIVKEYLIIHMVEGGRTLIIGKPGTFTSSLASFVGEATCPINEAKLATLQNMLIAEMCKDNKLRNLHIEMMRLAITVSAAVAAESYAAFPESGTNPNRQKTVVRDLLDRMSQADRDGMVLDVRTALTLPEQEGGTETRFVHSTLLAVTIVLYTLPSSHEYEIFAKGHENPIKFYTVQFVYRVAKFRYLIETFSTHDIVERIAIDDILSELLKKLFHVKDTPPPGCDMNTLNKNLVEYINKGLTRLKMTKLDPNWFTSPAEQAKAEAELLNGPMLQAISDQAKEISDLKSALGRALDKADKAEKKAEEAAKGINGIQETLTGINGQIQKIKPQR